MASKLPSKDTAHLRQLMKKASKVQTINSPFAKYNNIGQLICVICTVPIKSDEAIWKTHCLSLKHKENLLAYKEQLQQKNKKNHKIINENMKKVKIKWKNKL